MDWIPGVSQLKSVCQLVTGDVEGAAKTQENFVKECPGVSQVTSVVQWFDGDTDGAVETQMRCWGTIDNFLNGIPLVGHIKGQAHHKLGHHEAGNRALNAATRSTVVLGSGVLGGILTGGTGAILAGIAAGAAYDLADTNISEKPKGLIAGIQTAIDNPNAGNIFDAIAKVVGDGLSGYAGGKYGTRVNIQMKLNGLETAQAVISDPLKAGIETIKTIQINVEPPTGGSAAGVNVGAVVVKSNKDAINQVSSPQYVYDVRKRKSKKLPAEGSTGSVNVVESNKEENDLETEGYADETQFARSEKKKKYLRNKHAQQKPVTTTVSQTLRSKVTIVSSQQSSELIENIQNKRRDPKENKLLARSMLGPMLLPVPMPQEFGYTGAILANDPIQGLLHTYFRHWNQWEDYIPGLSQLRQNLPARVQELLDDVLHNVPNAINELKKEIQKLKNKTDIDEALLEIQMLLYEFLLENVTSERYDEDGANSYDRHQVYFEVTNIRTGRPDIMVLGTSRNLFPPIPEFGVLPVHTIITVFFKSLTAHKTSHNRIGKVWK